MLPFTAEGGIRNAGSNPIGGSVIEGLEELDELRSAAPMPIGILEFDSALVLLAMHMEPFVPRFVLSDADIKHARDVVGMVEGGKQLC